jgi:hypothetical protein
MLKVFGSRIYREKVTIHKMIQLYCSDNHKSNDSLCEHCENLLNYAFSRLDNCPYGIEKPACNKCPIHCYRNDEREEVKKVMRYSGPKMLFHHPLLAIMHLIDRKKEAPELRKKRQSDKATVE